MNGFPWHDRKRPSDLEVSSPLRANDDNRIIKGSFYGNLYLNLIKSQCIVVSQVWCVLSPQISLQHRRVGLLVSPRG